MELLHIIIQKTKDYKIEATLIGVSLFLTFSSIGFFILNKETAVQTVQAAAPFVLENPKKKISVEISGAVEKPDVYEVSNSARLKDLIQLAGGLSSQADKAFFARNFNQARFIQDQEKIHIPSIYEVSTGIFTEERQLINQIQVSSESTAHVENQNSSKININFASTTELDSLPGVGKVTAEKIIENRPYSSIEELVEKDIIKQNVFDSIQEQIES